MATPVIIVLAIVAMVSLVAVLAVVSQLVARLRRLRTDLADIEQHLMPAIQRLQADAEVTSRELERLGDALDERGVEHTTAADLVTGADGAVDSSPSNGTLADDLTRQEQP